MIAIYGYSEILLVYFGFSLLLSKGPLFIYFCLFLRCMENAGFPFKNKAKGPVTSFQKEPDYLQCINEMH